MPSLARRPHLVKPCVQPTEVLWAVAAAKMVKAEITNAKVPNDQGLLWGL